MDRSPCSGRLPLFPRVERMLRCAEWPWREMPAGPMLSEKHVLGQKESPIYPPPVSVGARKDEGSPTAAFSPLLVLAVSAEGSQACAKGCELCSEVNGCLKCSPKLFILLERNDIRQVGVCLPSCPPGYFDARNPDMNKCISECGHAEEGH